MEYSRSICRSLNHTLYGFNGSSYHVFGVLSAFVGLLDSSSVSDGYRALQIFVHFVILDKTIYMHSNTKGNE